MTARRVEKKRWRRACDELRKTIRRGRDDARLQRRQLEQPSDEYAVRLRADLQLPIVAEHPGYLIRGVIV